MLTLTLTVNSSIFTSILNRREISDVEHGMQTTQPATNTVWLPCCGARHAPPCYAWRSLQRRWQGLTAMQPFARLEQIRLDAVAMWMPSVLSPFRASTESETRFDWSV